MRTSIVWPPGKPVAFNAAVQAHSLTISNPVVNRVDLQWYTYRPPRTYTQVLITIYTDDRKPHASSAPTMAHLILGLQTKGRPDPQVYCAAQSCFSCIAINQLFCTAEQSLRYRLANPPVKALVPCNDRHAKGALAALPQHTDYARRHVYHHTLPKRGDTETSAE